MKNALENLILLMQRSEKRMSSQEYVFEDEKIITMLDDLEDINTTDSYDRTLLMYSIIYEREKVVEYLLKRNANIEWEEKRHFRALHFAAQSGNHEIISLLLNAGAEPNAKNIFGNNAIMLCDLATKKSVMELLISHGVNPYQKNNFDVSAYDVFAAYPEILAIFKTFKKTD